MSWIKIQKERKKIYTSSHDTDLYSDTAAELQVTGKAAHVTDIFTFSD